MAQRIYATDNYARYKKRENIRRSNEQKELEKQPLLYMYRYKMSYSMKTFFQSSTKERKIFLKDYILNALNFAFMKFFYAKLNYFIIRWM